MRLHVHCRKYSWYIHELNFEFNLVASGVPNGATSVPQPKSIPAVKPRPKMPRPQPRKPRVPSSPIPEAIYDDPMDELAGRRGQPNRHSDPNDYDDPDALFVGHSRRMKPTREGMYDDIQDVLGE